jgi:hypothetical protein
MAKAIDVVLRAAGELVYLKETWDFRDSEKNFEFTAEQVQAAYEAVQAGRLDEEIGS